MSKGFSINDILGSTKANAPAGQKMQVVMLPAADIEPNPENSIYEIGDKGVFNLDCELYCYGVEKTDGAGIVLECDDFEPSPGGDAQ